MSAGEIELKGEVVREAFAPGSKSEHGAVFLKTASGNYKLRRTGGNAFNDPELNKLVGKKITARGRVEGYLFVMKEYE